MRQRRTQASLTTMTHMYPVSSVLSDYLRSAAGVALTGGPVLFMDQLPAVSMVVLSGLASLFVSFAIQTAWRQHCDVETSNETIAVVPKGTRLRWDALTEVRLAYYSTRRDAEHGWMQLTLREGPRQIRVDSRLDGFAEVARRSAGAAWRNGLALGPATVSNLSALGIALPENTPDDGAVAL